MLAATHKRDTPLPLTLISGYLGSGKTTAINHLLRQTHARRIVVLVNDFGDLVIDAELIETHAGDTLTLANGCICCSMGGQFMKTLSRVLDMQPRPEHILIEASGVADPRRIADIAHAEPDMRLDCVTTFVDASAFCAQLDDAMISKCITDQIKAGDVLALNKTDLVEAKDVDRVRAALERITPDATVVRAHHGRIAPELLLAPSLADGGGQRRKADNTQAAHPAGGDIEHESLYVRWSHHCTSQLGEHALRMCLAALPPGVLRLKGIVAQPHAKPSLLVNVVGRRIDIAHSPEHAPRRPEETRLVAIGLRDRLNVNLLDDLFSELAIKEQP